LSKQEVVTVIQSWFKEKLPFSLFLVTIFHFQKKNLSAPSNIFLASKGNSSWCATEKNAQGAKQYSNFAVFSLLA